MRVVWTETALDDMADIRDYIAEDSPENAYRFIEHRFEAAESLTDQPKMGRQVTQARRIPDCLPLCESLTMVETRR